MVDNRGVSRKGEKTPVHSKELYDKIRKRLKMSKQELPDKTIQKIIFLSNKEIGEWILNNEEGFAIPHNMGYLAISKVPSKPLLMNKYDIIEEIDNSNLPEEYKEKRRKQYLQENYIEKKSKDLVKNRKLSNSKMIQSMLFNSIRPMWFNFRNTDVLKARAYWFSINRTLGQKMGQMILAGKDYYNLTAQDYAKKSKYKIKE